MLLLPSWTWPFDPVLFHLPRAAVSLTIGGIGLLMVFYGLAKKEREQIVTGAVFAAAALAIFQFMQPTIELRIYSMLFVVVFLGGHALLNWQIKRGGGGPDVAGDFIVYGVLGVLVGARLGHVLFYDLDKAIADPIWVFKIWTGGLASHGAVVGLIIAMYLFTKSRGVSFLEGSDRFSFSAALGATVVRVGNLFNSEIVGRKVPDQSWGMRFPLNPEDKGLIPLPLRYPSQLYEIALGTGVFIALIIADRMMGKEKRPRGALISWFFALYFTGRLFTEFYKEIEALPSDSAISMGQYLSILPALLGWYGLYWAFKHKQPAGWNDGSSAPDEEDEEEDDSDEEEDDSDEEEELPARARKASPSKRAASKVQEDEDDDEEPVPTQKSVSVDPDVESEFEAGKLKKSRGEPEE
jgi:phosphatidylglycerol:prolipoprotein diacylglycerol transferase